MDAFIQGIRVSNELLITKLSIPPLRAGIVARPRLIVRLNEGANHKLTLVSAPPGFGKSTLLNDWIHPGSHASPRKTGVMSPAGLSESLCTLLSRVAWL